MKVEGETAYCVDIKTNFKNGYKTRADASTRMSADQISDVALSLESLVRLRLEAWRELWQEVPLWVREIKPIIPLQEETGAISP